uniref:non-specific serine/threonine protein kinase n=1 Tax=Salmo trutta TaxID=8032 RepID=A0A673ZA55_SALTR
QSRRSWIEDTFCKRECAGIGICLSFASIPLTPRCCCGRLVGEHTLLETGPSMSSWPGPGTGQQEEWSVECHTQTSATDAYGTIDFQDSAGRNCHAKYVRVAVDAKAEALLQLMRSEWQMERPKLLLTVHGGTENFPLPLKVRQAFSKGLITAAQSTGAWILTDGINTGVSRYVGEAVKKYGTHDLRKRNAVGVTPWGVIDNHSDLIGRDVLRPYQPLGNPLSKRVCLNGLHSHFLLVDDGTLGKHGCQLGLRRKLERHIQLQKIHPRLNQGVPVVCVVVEGGPDIVSMVLEYVSSVPPMPVFVFEGSGRAADLLAFLHKQTAIDRCGALTWENHPILAHFYLYKTQITIFDSESEDQQEADCAILTATLKGTKTSPGEQLSTALAWDRADIAKKHILVYGQHWQVGSLEQAMLDALVMDRVGFVKLLIDNGMTMNRFLTVSRLEELYNTQQGPTDNFLHLLVEDVKQTHIPKGYRVSLIDVGQVIEYLIGGAYRSTYTRKHFRAHYNLLYAHYCTLHPHQSPNSSPSRPPFFRTAQPYKRKVSLRDLKVAQQQSSELGDSPLFVYNFNDLFVWAVLQRRQQMALFLWQHGEEAMARATVACKLYRAMAYEFQQSNMDDTTAEQLKTYSMDFGQLAVDVLDRAFRQNERMAMKLLTSEMEAWSHFTCLQMAVSSRLRPFVSHSCTQMLLTDLWTGRLNMRKNSWFKIILSILMPPAILLLEFKSQAEMSHVPQSQEALQFGWDTGRPEAAQEGGHTVVKVPKCTPYTSLPECQSFQLYDFYTAPVVKFWFHTMSYLAFLMLFSYTVLVKMEDRPSTQEWLVIAYIISTAVEKTREVFMSVPRKPSQKLKVWFGEYWNVTDFLAIVLFLVGLGLRWDSGSYRTAGRITYCLDIIFWYVRVLDLLAVNQHAGAYLTMITKMTSNMFYIVVMMAIVLLSFGVSRKAILSPDEALSWSLLRDVVNQPYWMMFGEVYAGEIDTCAGDTPCVPGAFLTPFLQAVYLFFQYIIMVNILIAFFNNIYFDMKSISNKLWKYNRYRYIMTYQEKPWLPPPLIILSHMTLCVTAIYRKHRELYLGQEDLKRLHEFEERCLMSYFHEKNQDVLCSQINRVRATAERAEEMGVVMGEVSDRVHFIQDTLQVLDSQLGQLQDLSALAVDTLTLLSASDSLQQEEARLGHCRPITPSRHHVPHSWTLPHGGGGSVDIMPCHTPRAYRSTPPSLLWGHTSRSQRPSLEWHTGVWGAGDHGGQGTGECCVPSRCGSPPYPSAWAIDSSLEPPHGKPRVCCDPEMSMEEEGEEFGKSFDVNVSRASSRAFLNNLMRLAHTIPFTPVSTMGKSSANHVKGTVLDVSIILDSPSVWLFLQTVLKFNVAMLVEIDCFCFGCIQKHAIASLIPIFPVVSWSLAVGEEVSVYSLEEVEVAGPESSISSWSSQGLSAVLQPLSSEGCLDGGLRRATLVLCTWAERDVLRVGCVYVVKAIQPDVVRTWQRVFHSDTPLQLCLREIQQQRAAQKLMHVFNQVKPENMPHSPRFLDMSLLHWHSDGQWLTIERNMTGDFRKYNNNTGEEIAPCCGMEETLLAFSHWTYQYSCRELLVLDLQGVGSELTDPSVIRAEDKRYSDDMVFGPSNLGDAAIHSFVIKHTCNSCCENLGLADLRRSTDIHGKTEHRSFEKESGLIMTRM